MKSDDTFHTTVCRDVILWRLYPQTAIPFPIVPSLQADDTFPKRGMTTVHPQTEYRFPTFRRCRPTSRSKRWAVTDHPKPQYRFQSSRRCRPTSRFQTLGGDGPPQNRIAVPNHHGVAGRRHVPNVGRRRTTPNRITVSNHHGVAGRRYVPKRGMVTVHPPNRIPFPHVPSLQADVTFQTLGGDGPSQKNVEIPFFSSGTAITGMELRYIMTLTDYINQYH